MAGAAERLRWTSIEDDAPLPGMGERITHPEFQGIEFVHVRAKSLLNHVPSAAQVPFDWTINVYRGCSHACTYCLAPDTPVLLADGRTRRIEDVRVGDPVYGTVRRGSDRHYSVTEVRDRWRTVKRAYRVTLADGTSLVSSGDHRLLTERGWKHVADAHIGQRPRLAAGDQLVGPGRSSTPFEHDDTLPADGTGRAATLQRTMEGLSLKSDLDLRVTAIEDLGVEMPMYDITTGTGDFVADGVVHHNCFARPSHTWLDLDAGRDFESVIVVKINAVERLRAELRSPRWDGEHVALGTNTDPYQRAEGRYRLTRGVVETLTDAGNSYSVLTKGTLITRDLDVLADAAKRGICTGAALSIPTLDDDVWRGTEPGAPHPARRMETVAALAEAGVPTGVMVAPIIPGLSDGRDQLERVIREAIDAGASHITPITLHLRPGVREIFLPWLEREHPELAERYQRLYQRAYAPEFERKRISRLVHELIAANGGTRPHPPTSHQRFRGGASRPASAQSGGRTPSRAAPRLDGARSDDAQLSLW